MSLCSFFITHTKAKSTQRQNPFSLSRYCRRRLCGHSSRGILPSLPGFWLSQKRPSVPSLSLSLSLGERPPARNYRLLPSHGGAASADAHVTTAVHRLRRWHAFSPPSQHYKILNLPPLSTRSANRQGGAVVVRPPHSVATMSPLPPGSRS